MELFFEAAGSRPIAHLTVTGTARIIRDSNEKNRLWNGGMFAYDLKEFWPKGPQSDDFALLLVTPSRVELGWQPARWTGQRAQVWKPRDLMRKVEKSTATLPLPPRSSPEDAATPGSRIS